MIKNLNIFSAYAYDISQHMLCYNSSNCYTQHYVHLAPSTHYVKPHQNMCLQYNVNGQCVQAFRHYKNSSITMNYDISLLIDTYIYHIPAYIHFQNQFTVWQTNKTHV